MDKRSKTVMMFSIIISLGIIFSVMFVTAQNGILGFFNPNEDKNDTNINFSSLDLIERTAYSNNYYNKTSGEYFSVVYSRQINIKNLSGEYEPYEDVTNLFFDGNSLVLEWNNKTVKFEIYTKDSDGKKEKLKDKSKVAKDELDFKTNIGKNNGMIYYNHTLNKEKQPFKIGYDITTENVNCFSESYKLICDEQVINFEQVVLEQNLSLILDNNSVEFFGDDLSYIDPTITLSGAESYTRGCWEEKDPGGNIADYDCNVEAGEPDENEVRVGWDGNASLSGYAGNMYKDFVGFNISSINNSWLINSITFRYYPDAIAADSSHDTIVFEELSQTDFEDGFLSTVDLTPDSYLESETAYNAIGNRSEYGTEINPVKDQYNEIILNEDSSHLRLSVDIVNKRYFYVGLQGTASGLYGNNYWSDIDDDDSANPPELVISYTPPDTTAPETSISATSPPGGASYTFGSVTNNNIQVTLSCSDSGGSGCKSSYPKYCTDITNTCSPIITYSSPFTVSTGGTSYIRSYSKDNANNSEVIDYAKMIINKNYTKNISMYVNSSKVWNYSDYFASARTSNDFSQELNNFLENCTADSEGYCNIPIIIHSDSPGRINVSNINIYFNITEYAWNITNLAELSTYKVRVKANDGLLNSSWDESDEDFIIGKLSYPQISFIPPTPANATSTSNTSIKINISINLEDNLNEVKFNWNGTNYTIYNDSLIFMMNFDNLSALGENSTYAVDVSRYGNNGIINGAIINSSSGKYGMGISFNGSSSVSTFTASFNNFSVCAWARPSSIPNAIKHIVATDAWTGFYLYISSNNGSVFGVNNGQETTSYVVQDIMNWHYYCGVYNSTNVSLFVDGILRKTSPASGPTASRLIKIGAGVSYYFNGSIDEARIWNRSLSSSEIQELYFINLNKYNSSQWYLFVNQSKNSSAGLDIGNYSYFASAKNNLENSNQTEKRWLEISGVLSYLGISFTYPTPANATTTSNTFVIVNVSIKESNLNEVKFNWNGTNYTIYNDSLILMMNFDNISLFGEGANNFTADVSKYNNSGNCTGMGAGCNWIGGKYGKGISFDGVDDKVTAFSASFLSFTVCAWAKPSAVPGAIKHIVATNVWTGFYLYISSSNGSRFGVNNGQETEIYTVPSITDWHYYCGTYNSTNVSLFVDGVLRKTGSASGATAYAPIWIGAGPSYFFNGTIDEARIWNRSLADSEIYELYVSNLQKYNQTQWYLYINQSKNSTSGLDYGNYSYFASAKNNNGDENITEIRWLTIESEGEAVTNCRNLDSAGATYILNSDINNDTITSDCIVISAQNITFDCNGHYIKSIQNYSGIYSNQYNTTIKNCNITIGGASGSNSNAIGIEFNGVNNGAIYNNTCNSSVGYGIYLNNSSNNNLTSNTGKSDSNTGIYIYSGSNNSLINNTGTSKSSRGIYLHTSSNNILIDNIGTSDLISGIYLYSSNNNILSNNTGICSSGYGIYLNAGSNNSLTGNIGASNISYGFYLYSGSNNNILTNNIGTSNTSYVVYLYNSNNNTLINHNSTGYLTGSYGFFLLNSNNNTIKDCIYVSGITNDIYLTSNSINNIFINCSYTISKESIQPGSQLFRKWWYRAYVNDSNGNPVNNADVNAYNVTGSLEFAQVTSGDGYTEVTPITDYVNYGGTRSYYSSYNINATNGTSTSSHSYNATLSLNNLNDVFTFTL